MHVWTDKSNSADFTIGQLAKKAGVNIETIRYYERRGLLKKPRRSILNYRIYSDDELKRIQFIKRAQKLGFTLEEIKELLAVSESSVGQNYAAYEIARRKIRELSNQLETLQMQLRELTRLASACASENSITTKSPLIEALEEDLATVPG